MASSTIRANAIHPVAVPAIESEFIIYIWSKDVWAVCDPTTDLTTLLKRNLFIFEGCLWSKLILSLHKNGLRALYTLFALSVDKSVYIVYFCVILNYFEFFFIF